MGEQEHHDERCRFFSPPSRNVEFRNRTQIPSSLLFQEEPLSVEPLLHVLQGTRQG